MFDLKFPSGSELIPLVEEIPSPRLVMFSKGKELCEKFYVLLQTDSTLERPEKLKPLFSLQERKRHLNAIKYIDGVIPYTYESELYQLIQDGGFDLRLLGDDYKGKSYTGDDLNIEVFYIDRSHGWSATKYKELIAHSINSKSNVLQEFQRANHAVTTLYNA